jgi:hypothetical protein
MKMAIRGLAISAGEPWKEDNPSEKTKSSQNSLKHRSRRQSAIFVNLPENQGTSLIRKSTTTLVSNVVMRIFILFHNTLSRRL